LLPFFREPYTLINMVIMYYGADCNMFGDVAKEMFHLQMAAMSVTVSCLLHL
jgi:hypothetical protein